MKGKGSGRYKEGVGRREEEEQNKGMKKGLRCAVYIQVPTPQNECHYYKHILIKIKSK